MGRQRITVKEPPRGRPREMVWPQRLARFVSFSLLLPAGLPGSSGPVGASAAARRGRRASRAGANGGGRYDGALIDVPLESGSDDGRLLPASRVNSANGRRGGAGSVGAGLSRTGEQEDSADIATPPTADRSASSRRRQRGRGRTAAAALPVGAVVPVGSGGTSSATSAAAEGNDEQTGSAMKRAGGAPPPKAGGVLSANAVRRRCVAGMYSVSFDPELSKYANTAAEKKEIQEKMGFLFVLPDTLENNQEWLVADLTLSKLRRCRCREQKLVLHFIQNAELTHQKLVLDLSTKFDVGQLEGGGRVVADKADGKRRRGGPLAIGSTPEEDLTRTKSWVMNGWEVSQSSRIIRGQGRAGLPGSFDRAEPAGAGGAAASTPKYAEIAARVQEHQDDEDDRSNYLTPRGEEEQGPAPAAVDTRATSDEAHGMNAGNGANMSGLSVQEQSNSNAPVCPAMENAEEFSEYVYQRRDAATAWLLAEPSKKVGGRSAPRKVVPNRDQSFILENIAAPRIATRARGPVGGGRSGARKVVEVAPRPGSILEAGVYISPSAPSIGLIMDKHRTTGQFAEVPPSVLKEKVKIPKCSTNLFRARLRTVRAAMDENAASLTTLRGRSRHAVTNAFLENQPEVMYNCMKALEWSLDLMDVGDGVESALGSGDEQEMDGTESCAGPGASGRRSEGGDHEHDGPQEFRLDQTSLRSPGAATMLELGASPAQAGSGRSLRSGGGDIHLATSTAGQSSSSVVNGAEPWRELSHESIALRFFRDFEIDDVLRPVSTVVRREGFEVTAAGSLSREGAAGEGEALPQKEPSSAETALLRVMKAVGLDFDSLDFLTKTIESEEGEEQLNGHRESESSSSLSLSTFSSIGVPVATRQRVRKSTTTTFGTLVDEEEPDDDEKRAEARKRFGTRVGVFVEKSREQEQREQEQEQRRIEDRLNAISTGFPRRQTTEPEDWLTHGFDSFSEFGLVDEEAAARRSSLMPKDTAEGTTGAAHFVDFVDSGNDHNIQRRARNADEAAVVAEDGGDEILDLHFVALDAQAYSSTPPSTALQPSSTTITGGPMAVIPELGSRGQQEMDTSAQLPAQGSGSAQLRLPSGSLGNVNNRGASTLSALAIGASTSGQLSASLVAEQQHPLPPQHQHQHPPTTPAVTASNVLFEIPDTKTGSTESADARKSKYSRVIVGEAVAGLQSEVPPPLAWRLFTFPDEAKFAQESYALVPPIKQLIELFRDEVRGALQDFEVAKELIRARQSPRGMHMPQQNSIGGTVITPPAGGNGIGGPSSGSFTKNTSQEGEEVGQAITTRGRPGETNTSEREPSLDFTRQPSVSSSAASDTEPFFSAEEEKRAVPASVSVWDSVLNQASSSGAAYACGGAPNGGNPYQSGSDGPSAGQGSCPLAYFLKTVGWPHKSFAGIRCPKQTSAASDEKHSIARAQQIQDSGDDHTAARNSNDFVLQHEDFPTLASANASPSGGGAEGSPAGIGFSARLSAVGASPIMRGGGPVLAGGARRSRRGTRRQSIAKQKQQQEQRALEEMQRRRDRDVDDLVFTHILNHPQLSSAYLLQRQATFASFEETAGDVLSLSRFLEREQHAVAKKREAVAVQKTLQKVLERQSREREIALSVEVQRKTVEEKEFARKLEEQEKEFTKKLYIAGGVIFALALCFVLYCLLHARPEEPLNAPVVMGESSDSSDDIITGGVRGSKREDLIGADGKLLEGVDPALLSYQRMQHLREMMKDITDLECAYEQEFRASADADAGEQVQVVDPAAVPAPAGRKSGRGGKNSSRKSAGKTMATPSSASPAGDYGRSDTGENVARISEFTAMGKEAA